MNELRSIADQLRSKISAPDIPLKAPEKKVYPKKKVSPKEAKTELPASNHSKIMDRIHAYDNSNHKNMVHVRFDVSTAQLLNQFKMATGTDISKLVAFSVQELFNDHPELKLIIKQFIQKLEL